MRASARRCGERAQATSVIALPFSLHPLPWSFGAEAT